MPIAAANKPVAITRAPRWFHLAVTERILLIRRLRGNLETSRDDCAAEHVEHRFYAVGNKRVGVTNDSADDLHSSECHADNHRPDSSRMPVEADTLKLGLRGGGSVGKLRHGPV